MPRPVNERMPMVRIDAIEIERMGFGSMHVDEMGELEDRIDRLESEINDLRMLMVAMGIFVLVVVGAIGISMYVL